MQKISPFLWFDSQAEEAMNFYVSIFKNSKVLDVHRWGEGGPVAAGTVMSCRFQLEGTEYQALNGGPHFTFTPAISLFVHCADQAEVDRYWNAFLAGGGKESQCGWLSDKFGLSWQIIPKQLGEYLGDKDPVKSGRAMAAMMKMKKIDVQQLKEAFDGK